MTKTVRFDGISFHDAVFTSSKVSIIRKSCEINISLWGEGGERRRDTSTFNLRGAREFSGRFDFEELADHARAGNVQDGNAGGSPVSLYLHLAGGYVETVADSVELHRSAQMNEMDAFQEVGQKSGFFQNAGDDYFDFSYLESVEFSPGTRSCRLKMQLRIGSASFERSPAIVHFDGVSSCLAKIDIMAMADGHPFGNVRSCMIEVGKKMVRMYLNEGFIEIVAESASVAHG